MVAKYVREQALVELLMRRRGLTVESYVDPNTEASDETGADVIAIVGSSRIGIQVTELDTGRVAGQGRASEKAAWRDAQERGDGTYASWAQSNPSELVAAIARAVTSKMQQIIGCDEAWLLISASLPELGTLVSTFVITQWLPAEALNEATVSKLAGCNYARAFLHVIVGDEDTLYIWSPSSNWQKETGQDRIAEPGKNFFDLRDDPSELQKWLNDPDGKAAEESEKVFLEFAKARGQHAANDTVRELGH